MVSYSPAASAGRGRLAAAVAISALCHAWLFADGWNQEWMPSISGVAAVNTKQVVLSVLLETGTNPEFPSVQNNEVFLLKKQSDLEHIPLSSELREEKGETPKSDDYLTKDRISVSAQPLTDIQIPWPSGLPVVGVKSAIFTIFIDELGVVRDVVPDGHTLLPAMEEVARKTFLEARFRPALQDGQAVKSIKRVEVEFEYSPIHSTSNVPELIDRKELK